MNKNFNLKKTLLFNLIMFDFILLESSIKKISNFFLEKFNLQNNSLKKNIYRLSNNDVLKSFKRFIKFLNFFKNYYPLITILYSCDSIIPILKVLFKQFSYYCFFRFKSLNNFSNLKFFFNKLILIDYPLINSEFFSFFFKKNFLIQTIDSFEKNFFSIYKIFSNLEDFKKLIFFGLIIISIFKK